MEKEIPFLFFVLISLILVLGCIDTNQQPSAQIVTEPQSVIDTPVITPVNTLIPIATSEQQIDLMVPIVREGMINISPLFVAFDDDYKIEDYEQLAKDNLKLQKEVDKQQDLFGETIGESQIKGINDISDLDKILYQRYSGYLVTLDDLCSSANIALKYLNDDNYYISPNDKFKLRNLILDAQIKTYDQIETIFDICPQCGEDDPVIAELKSD